MMKLDGLAAFVAVAESGSVSGAARRLGLSKSVVSERLAELERALGARLAQRTTRKMTLTEDGLAFLERARRIIRELNEAADEVSERRGALSGSLRISAPVSFGSLHLGPALYPFLAANPAVAVTLELDDRFIDMAADGYDAVVRHGPVRDSWLVAARLAHSRRFLVAAPSYLAAHGTPRTLADLEGCRAILYTNRDADWRFPGAAVVRPRPALRVNNGLMMRDAAVAGLGLTLLPSFMMAEQLTRGDLVVVDVGVEAEGAEIHIAYPKDHSAAGKIRTLAAHLRQAFGDPPYWEAGLPLP